MRNRAITPQDVPQVEKKLRERVKRIAPQLDNVAGMQRLTDAMFDASIGEKEQTNGLLTILAKLLFGGGK